MMDPPPTFTSPTEEASYWKSLAQDYHLRYEESAEELEEFQISSRELEAELEAQLDQAETKVRDLTSANQRLQMENESLSAQNLAIQSESHRQINSLADDLGSISKSKEELVTYVRELEMSNDSLENSKRQTISTLEDFEQRLNQALERNAYLENELEEKDQLQATIQRLKDESRDLRMEMTLKKTRSPSSVSLPMREAAATSIGSGGDDVEEDDAKVVGGASSSAIIRNGIDHTSTTSSSRHSPSPSSNASRSPALSTSSINNAASNVNLPVVHNNNVNGIVGVGVGNNPLMIGSTSEMLTPTARITALNIVGDLLRKVGSLESKLASCRTTTSSMSAVVGSSPVGSPSSMMITGEVKPRATTIGAEFSPVAFPASRPRANAVSATPKYVNCENYV